MGYYTSHTLEVANGDDSLIEQFIAECEDAAYALDAAGECRQESKWYSCDKDLKAFSIKHPGVLFILKGVGEESDDIWIEYHKNGKVQACKAKIVFADFDENKLI